MKHLSAQKGMLLWSILLILFLPDISSSQNLPAPYNFQSELMSGNPDQILMTWDFDLDTTLGFQFFLSIRDSAVFGTSSSQSMAVPLSDFNQHCYWVAAHYTQGTSEWAGPLCGSVYPPPYNVDALFNNVIVPAVDISWDHDADSVQYFIVERDGFQVGTTTEHFFQDYVPAFINYCYNVYAVYSTGTSAPAGPACCNANPLLPEMTVIPEWIESEISADDSLSHMMGILNTGDWVLWYSYIGFTPWTSTQGFISIESNTIGFVPEGGGIVNVPVEWFSEGYAPGTYHQELVILSNDPNNLLEVVPNTMHVGPMSFLTGDIVNVSDNDPVYGVEINAGIQYDQTDTNGHYSFRVPANTTLDVTYEKPGYEPLIISITTGNEGTSIVIDTGLVQLSLGLNWVLAEVDCNDPAPAFVSWSEPEFNDEILYDNNLCTDLHFWDFAGGEHAVKFTPTDYPAIVIGGSFHVGSGVYPEGNWLNTSVRAFVYDVGPDGMPGDVLDSTISTINDYGWVDCYFGYNAHIDSGDFFISVEQASNWPHTPPIGVDNYFSQDNYSFMKHPLGSWDTAGFRNFMIRAEILYESGENTSGYIISRASDFDPNLGPQIGTHTILDTVTELNYIDSSFEFVDEAWYAYAVEPVFTSGQTGQNGYSNIIGHDMGKIVTFQVEDCNGDPIDSLEIMMVGEDYPYEIFAYPEQPPYTNNFDCVWKGWYTVTVDAQGFTPIQLNTQILADTTFYFMFDSTIYPVSNLWVDTINTIAYWDASPDTADVLNYSVYLDGQFVDSTDSTFYPFTGLPFDQYTVCVEANYACGPSDPVCTDFGGGYFQAPSWIEADSMGSDVLLTWYMDTTGFGNALIGFKLYRDSVYFKYIPYVIGQDTFTHLDTNLAPMCYEYHVSAFYDLETYGYYMQFGDSELTGPAEVCLVRGDAMPIYEDWASGSFGSFWTAEENWRINGQFGEPSPPTSEFTWDPAITDYNSSLTSGYINGVYIDSSKQEYLDGKILLEFYLKLGDNSASGTEQFLVEVWSHGNWWVVKTFNNDSGGFGFQKYTVDLTDFALGNTFKIRFVANGEWSPNILYWYLDNIEVYHYCPEPLNAELDIYDQLIPFILTWSPPDLGGSQGVGEWIHWDDGVNVNGIGLTGGGVFSVASRWDPDMIAQYSGMFITKIRFVPYANASGSQFTLKVWEGTDAGTLLYEQDVNSYIAGEWNEYMLTLPVAIDVSKELWFGYTVDAPDGENPAGTDDGPAEIGYGDMISLDGIEWDPISNLGPFDLNWNIQAYIQPDTGDMIQLDRNQNKDLLGYNIFYSDDWSSFEWIDFTTDTFYIHDAWAYFPCYYVTTVYESCESEPSNWACWFMSVDEYELKPRIKVYPVPAKNVIQVEGDLKILHLCILDLSGRELHCKENIHQKQHSLNVSDYGPGVYMLRIDTKQGRAVRKIVIAR